MSGNSKIEWTEKTWNPVTGCAQISLGCKHCYAKREWVRLSANPKSVYFGRAFTDVQCHEERIDAPLHWRKPSMIFVNSMSDLFHGAVPFEFVHEVFAVMARCPQHTFQILTKRPDRMEHYFQQGVGTEMVVRDNVKYELAVAESLRWPLPNVWLGVSVESPKYLSRIDVLREVPAAVRMVSFEPLLSDLGEVNLDGIGWVIVGGESGPKARPMHPRWARSLRDQCEAARVPFFFKQWGEWGLGGGHPSGTPGRFVLVSDTQSCEVSCEVDQYPRHFNSFGSAVMERLGKHAAGRLLDGVEWSEYPERVA